MTILTGHTSPEIAYLINDYPYGFRLRCSAGPFLRRNAAETPAIAA
jgi:hypothetical protein